MLRPLESSPSSNLVDMGWVGGAYRCPVCVVWGGGNFWEGATSLAWEVTVKVYGVAVTMPQG